MTMMHPTWICSSWPSGASACRLGAAFSSPEVAVRMQRELSAALCLAAAIILAQVLCFSVQLASFNSIMSHWQACIHIGCVCVSAGFSGAGS